MALDFGMKVEKRVVPVEKLAEFSEVNALTRSLTPAFSKGKGRGEAMDGGVSRFLSDLFIFQFILLYCHTDCFIAIYYLLRPSIWFDFL